MLIKFAFLGFLLPAAALAQGLDGQIGIHDPSTVVRCNDRFYTYGTGSGSKTLDPESPDYKWERAAWSLRRTASRTAFELPPYTVAVIEIRAN